MPLVHLPQTIARPNRPRPEISFAKLLSRVDPEATNGFGFEGVFLKRGAVLEEAALWPDPSYPSTPVLLECAGITGLTASGAVARGHRRSEMLFVLWTYRDRTWIELARACSDSWSWTVELRPIALRALAQQPRAELLPSLEAVTVRISSFLAAELAKLEIRDRGFVLGVLHDQFAARIAGLL